MRIRWKLRQSWREFRAHKPGRRFQERYARHRQARQARPPVLRVLRTGLALFLALVGVVLVFIPGPAILFFAVAAAMLSDDWHALARALDWMELRARRVVRKIANVADSSFQR